MTKALSEAEIIEKLQKLDNWERDDNKITKTFKFDSYLSGVAFATSVGVIAEGLDHHPDIAIGWRKVVVSFTTHDAGNALSEKDFAAAQAIDDVGYPKS